MPLPPTRVDRDRLDAAIVEHTEAAFGFLERLVAAPSTVGQEAGAQRVLAAELDRLGFTVREVEIPEDIALDPVAGVPQLAYAGRPNIVGELIGGEGPSLILNGHMDVVPAEDALWSTPPFQPVRRDGWMIGRGAGDMKGGFAMGVLALSALADAAPGWLTGRLNVVAAIEEECTGNGTLATARAGVTADAAVLLEPSDLGILLGGVGVLWVEVGVAGRAAHAESAHQAVNPVTSALGLLDALRDLEAAMAVHATGPFAAIAKPYNINVGSVTAGNWPSSVPGQATLGIRVGFPGSWSPDEALRQVSAAIGAAADRDPWLAEHPPVVRASGFRAEGYALDADHPLAELMAVAHTDVHGAEPARFVLGSTTDARLYLNQFGIPALAYGPRTRNIHGADEAVELDSIVDGARTLANFLLRYFEADR